MLLEIIVAIGAISFVGLILGRYIYKRIKGIPTGECYECKKRFSADNLKEYYYKHKNECHCQK